ncbi:hypothetical protein Pflav_005570 [Phytohabitans flavus]|uniref:Uncharacterized protein n=1 Tax=Phytohabitans flavus TaxID=1076124 RepID=A0A6F8XK08_9ACTN|nr:hypothetical protein Pflav_005570 [Phytohabitans flavus]
MAEHPPDRARRIDRTTGGRAMAAARAGGGGRGEQGHEAAYLLALGGGEKGEVAAAQDLGGAGRDRQVVVPGAGGTPVRVVLGEERHPRRLVGTGAGGFAGARPPK